MKTSRNGNRLVSRIDAAVFVWQNPIINTYFPISPLSCCSSCNRPRVPCATRRSKHAFIIRFPYLGVMYKQTYIYSIPACNQQQQHKDVVQARYSHLHPDIYAPHIERKYGTHSDIERGKEEYVIMQCTQSRHTHTVCNGNLARIFFWFCFHRRRRRSQILATGGR